MHVALRMAEETVEQTTALPFEPIFYGIGALAAFMAALLVTYAFRSVGTRH
ncbi:hypothetical protein [Cellulomonas fimi]|uniref:Uncharacterized protein n=1 Tax=Cellulomonas fimi TaxID=1708 RepID=A0A7Y0QJR8_CELFI|nr:hypothetical protein [Cellulomonas fimi]NMR21632.1 hypothetical protein [Cellulomonas fimi]